MLQKGDSAHGIPNLQKKTFLIQLFSESLRTVVFLPCFYFVLPFIQRLFRYPVSVPLALFSVFFIWMEL
jgi:hypothetical protein